MDRKELLDGRIVIVVFSSDQRSGGHYYSGSGPDTTAVALAAALTRAAREILHRCRWYIPLTRAWYPMLASYGRSPTEMLELASLGAAILQPRAVELAAAWGVTIHVRSSFGDALGTLVKGGDLMEKQRVVSGVTRDLNVVKVVLVDVPDRPGVAHKIFSTLANESINVDMIGRQQNRGL